METFLIIVLIIIICFTIFYLVFSDCEIKPSSEPFISRGRIIPNNLINRTGNYSYPNYMYPNPYFNQYYPYPNPYWLRFNIFPWVPGQFLLNQFAPIPFPMNIQPIETDQATNLI